MDLERWVSEGRERVEGWLHCVGHGCRLVFVRRRGRSWGGLWRRGRRR